MVNWWQSFAGLLSIARTGEYMAYSENDHLLFVYVIVSEAKSPESSFCFLLLALLKMFLATKLGKFSRCPKSIFSSLHSVVHLPKQLMQSCLL